MGNNDTSFVASQWSTFRKRWILCNSHNDTYFGASIRSPFRERDVLTGGYSWETSTWKISTIFQVLMHICPNFCLVQYVIRPICNCRQSNHLPQHNFLSIGKAYKTSSTNHSSNGIWWIVIPFRITVKRTVREKMQMRKIEWEKISSDQRKTSANRADTSKKHEYQPSHSLKGQYINSPTDYSSPDNSSPLITPHRGTRGLPPVKA